MRGLKHSVAVAAVSVVSGLSLVTWGAVTAGPAGADPTEVVFTADGTFVVPTGVLCMAIAVQGGEGGAGASDTAAGGNGGLGGEVVMFVDVEPGTAIGVFVGTKGADGVGSGGGAGGGASAVVLPNGEPFAVAGGGGGGGAAEGTNAGGEGGPGGNATAGRNGSPGASGSATAGSAGTVSGPGLAGVNDGAGGAPTDGAATPPDGGVGGTGAHGGGAGGGGYFGGGGGGSGETSPGAGGGGGGSAVNPAVFPTAGYATFADGVNEGDGVVVFAYGDGIDCGLAPLTVKKVVEGPVAPGTEFVVRVECVDPALIVPIGSPGNESARDFVFRVGDDGVARPVGGDTVTFDDPTSCTVTETVAGGASSVSYSCASSIDAVLGEARWVEPAVGPDAPICSGAGPADAPITVAIVNEGQRVLLTVTNTFEPTFTG